MNGTTTRRWWTTWQDEDAQYAYWAILDGEWDLYHHPWTAAVPDNPDSSESELPDTTIPTTLDWSMITPPTTPQLSPESVEGTFLSQLETLDHHWSILFLGRGVHDVDVSAILAATSLAGASDGSAKYAYKVAFGWVILDMGMETMLAAGAGLVLGSTFTSCQAELFGTWVIVTMLSEVHRYTGPQSLRWTSM